MRVLIELLSRKELEERLCSLSKFERDGTYFCKYCSSALVTDTESYEGNPTCWIWERAQAHLRKCGNIFQAALLINTQAHDLVVFGTLHDSDFRPTTVTSKM